MEQGKCNFGRGLKFGLTLSLILWAVIALIGVVFGWPWAAAIVAAGGLFLWDVTHEKQWTQ